MFHHNCTYNDRSRARIKPGTHQGAKDTSAFGSIEDRNSCTPLSISIYHTTAPICIPSRTFPIHTPFPLTNSTGIYNKLHGVRLHSNLSSRSVRSRLWVEVGWNWICRQREIGGGGGGAAHRWIIWCECVRRRVRLGKRVQCTPPPPAYHHAPLFISVSP